MLTATVTLPPISFGDISIPLKKPALWGPARWYMSHGDIGRKKVNSPIERTIDSRVMLPFGVLLKRHLKARRLSEVEFAKRVDDKQPNINHIIHGRPSRKNGASRRPPLEHLGRWADVLGLSGADRSEFLLAGELTHAPPGIQAFVAVTIKRIDTLRLVGLELVKQMREKGLDVSQTLIDRLLQ